MPFPLTVGCRQSLLAASCLTMLSVWGSGAIFNHFQPPGSHHPLWVPCSLWLSNGLLFPVIAIQRFEDDYITVHNRHSM